MKTVLWADSWPKEISKTDFLFKSVFHMFENIRQLYDKKHPPPKNTTLLSANLQKNHNDNFIPTNKLDSKNIERLVKIFHESY